MAGHGPGLTTPVPAARDESVRAEHDRVFGSVGSVARAGVAASQRAGLLDGHAESHQCLRPAFADPHVRAWRDGAVVRRRQREGAVGRGLDPDPVADRVDEQQLARGTRSAEPTVRRRARKRDSTHRKLRGGTCIAVAVAGQTVGVAARSRRAGLGVRAGCFERDEIGGVGHPCLEGIERIAIALRNAAVAKRRLARGRSPWRTALARVGIRNPRGIWRRRTGYAEHDGNRDSEPETNPTRATHVRAT